MSQRLPYTLHTGTGTDIDFVFPLHAETASAARVLQLTQAILDTVDEELRKDSATCNGDVLQALAIALAARTAMIAAPAPLTSQLASDLVEAALSAATKGRKRIGQVGHA